MGGLAWTVATAADCPSSCRHLALGVALRCAEMWCGDSPWLCRARACRLARCPSWRLLPPAPTWN